MNSKITMNRLLDFSRIDEVEGWFFPADRLIFEWLLSYQQSSGDLLELGAYKGKSAIFLGSYLREGETLTVCDLFDSQAPDKATNNEIKSYYPTLTRQVFEANYLKFHARLPTIVQGPSAVIASEVKPRSCRLVHVDASHLYHHVKGDIVVARDLLTIDGIIAVDDYRSPHTPGVAAATWEAVLTGELKPVFLTENKFYGSWGSTTELRQALKAWLATHEVLWGDPDEVAGHELIRVHNR